MSSSVSPSSPSIPLDVTCGALARYLRSITMNSLSAPDRLRSLSPKTNSPLLNMPAHASPHSTTLPVKLRPGTNPGDASRAARASYPSTATAHIRTRTLVDDSFLGGGVWAVY